MAKLIRKISIGKDYKNDAMHYAVGQEVYGGHTICDIIEEDDNLIGTVKSIDSATQITMEDNLASASADDKVLYDASPITLVCSFEQ